MFTLSFSNLLVIVLVAAAAWRGRRIIEGLRAGIERFADQREAGATPVQRRREAVEMVECPRCGLYVPSGRVCASREHCLHKTEPAASA